MFKHTATFFRRAPIYRALSKMPPLSNWLDRAAPWTPDQSPAQAWIRQQFPEVDEIEANRIFSAARSRKLVRIDPSTMLWSGTGDTADLDNGLAVLKAQAQTRNARLASKAARKERMAERRAASFTARQGTEPAPPRPKGGPRKNSRLAAALVVFARWKAASKVLDWPLADLIKSFTIHSGGGKPDTMKKYVLALRKAGRVCQQPDGQFRAN
jgi:hypothetical protein